MNLKKSISSFTVQDWIFSVFSVLWIGIVMLDYFNKQVVYWPSITHFKYTGLILFWLVIGGLLSTWYCGVGPLAKRKKLPLNGLVIFGVFMTLVCSIVYAYNFYWKAPLDYTNYLHLWGKGVFTLGAALLIVASAYGTGNLLRKRVFLDTNESLTIKLLDICIGFVVMTFGLMILGVIGVLQQLVVLLFLGICLTINYKAVFRLIKSVLWTPMERPSDLKWWGALLAFFLLAYIAMNYMYTQAPYPLGFDSRNYYVNIPKLIWESGELIMGYQPYAWGLIMSLGYIAFDAPEVTLFISAMGGLLSFIAIYDLCKNYLKVDANLTWLTILLYQITPTVTNHFMVEFKIDLALVFFQIVIINFLLWWLLKSRADRQSVVDERSDWSKVVLLGLLLGYCLSIKVLSVFLILAVFIAIWWYQKDVIGALGLAALSFGAVLLARIDDVSGLRAYHLSPTQTGIGVSLLGIGALVYSFIKYRQQTLQSLKVLTLCGMVVLLTFSPWIYKNYKFTKSTDIVKLIMGDKPRPELKLKVDRSK